MLLLNIFLKNLIINRNKPNLSSKFIINVFSELKLIIPCS